MMKKAGAVVVHDGKVLLIYRKKLDDWTFPKGHIEHEENAEATMIREIKEESGLDVRILQPLADHFYTSAMEGEVTTAMFLAEPIKPSQKLKPEHPEDKLRWTPIAEVNTVLSYENLQTYFQKLIDDGIISSRTPHE